MNAVWLALVAGGVLTGFITGRSDAVTRAALESASSAVSLSLGLVGATALWCGLMRVAEDAGIARWIARSMAPLARWLFPSIPEGHPAAASIAASLAANILGMGNAATPLGLRAMEDLASLTPGQDEANDAMCTFVVMCATGITLVPTTIVAVRAQCGSASPAEVVVPIILVNVVGMAVALMADRFMRPISHGRG